MNAFERIYQSHIGEWEDVTFEQLVEELELGEAYYGSSNKMQKQRKEPPPRRFRRSPQYKQTYLERIGNNQMLKNKLHFFMEAKRNNPRGQINAEDKFFASGDQYTKYVPGIRKYHISFDISIVYRVEQEGGEPIVYLYGFYTHDDLGTGQPGNPRKQEAMAKSFTRFQFESARRLRDRLGINFRIL